MRNLRKFVSLLLISSMILSCFTLTAYAEAGEYNLGLAYDSNLGNVEVVTANGASVQTASSDDISLASAGTTWKVDANTATAAKTTYVDDDNLTISTEFATSLKPLEATIDGTSYTHYIQVRLAADPGETLSEQSGSTPLIIKTKATGILTYAYRRQVQNDSIESGDGKDIKISKKNADNTYTLQKGNLKVDSITDDKKYAYCTQSIDVAPNEDYIIWAKGTTGCVYSVSFEAKEMHKATSGNTVTIKSTPKENAWIGNVSLNDETIPLTKNSDYTECSFTMPEKDVNVKVDFIDKSVGEETATLVTFDMIKGTNTAEDNIFEDLTLIQGANFSIGYADISWESSDPDTISKSGVVNTSTESKQVKMTAVCTFQDYPNLRITKDFNLTVPADTDDAGAVALAKESLTIGDTSAVRKDLTLPATGRRNTTVTWSSSNSAVVSNEGVVTRQKGIDTDVVLTATITRGSASDTKEFNVKVLGYTPVEVSRISVSNSDGRIVSVPTDGGYVSHIVYTDSISTADRTEKEILVAAVFDKTKNRKLTAYKIFNLKDITKEAGEETILTLQKEDIPVDSNSEIKVFAFDSMDSINPLMTKAYKFDPTLSSNTVVYVAGDSTASAYPATGASNRFPQTGWAQVLDNFFGNGVTINDLAISGRSSKSFRTEKNYDTIMNGLKPGDYFIIQFGHNDSKSGEESRYTDPSGDRFTDGSFKHSIYEYYVKPALEKGANPIITTSISRRKTSDSGLEAYVNAAKSLASELGLPYVDLYAKTNGYINDKNVGLEKAKNIYNYVNANDSRFAEDAALPESFKTSLGKSTMGEIGEFSKSGYVAGTTDDTHINYYGAQIISQWFCDELEAIKCPLTEKRTIHKVTLEDIPDFTAA